MKWLLSLSLVCLTSLLYGQKQGINSETNKIELTLIDSVPGTEDLYARSKLLVAETFRSAQNVIQLDDPVNKVLLIKGTIRIMIANQGTLGMVADNGHVAFTMKVQVRERRYKVSITDLFHTKPINTLGDGGELENEKPACGGMRMTKKQWDNIKAAAIEELMAYLSATKVQMIKPINSNDF